MWSYRGEKTNLSPGVFSLNIWMLPLHLFLISPLFVNDALLDSNVLKKTKHERGNLCVYNLLANVYVEAKNLTVRHVPLILVFYAASSAWAICFMFLCLTALTQIPAKLTLHFEV